MRTLIALLALVGSIAAADTVIVNPAVATSSVAPDTLKDIFLGRKTSWDDGSKIIVALVEKGPSNDALMKIVSKNDSQFTTGWKKLVFTGKGVMPEFLKDDASVAAFVAKTSGAIGFITSDAPAGVKTIPVQ